MDMRHERQSRRIGSKAKKDMYEAFFGDSSFVDDTVLAESERMLQKIVNELDMM